MTSLTKTKSDTNTTVSNSNSQNDNSIYYSLINKTQIEDLKQKLNIKLTTNNVKTPLSSNNSTPQKLANNKKTFNSNKRQRTLSSNNNRRNSLKVREHLRYEFIKSFNGIISINNFPLLDRILLQSKYKGSK